MTRKDYELIAAAFKRAKPFLMGFEEKEVEQAALYGFRIAANALASDLGAANPNFNRERFLTACGVDD